MPHRPQRTIERPAEVSGIGFFTGADVTLRFLPAPADHGLAFQRMDLPGRPTIPATLDYALPRQRRSAVGLGNATVELTEHVMAALAGLWIDNCLVQLNAPEPPGLDGSALGFVEALLEAGIVKQAAPRRVLRVERAAVVRGSDGQSAVTIEPSPVPGLTVGYVLDYGPQSPIPPQSVTLAITPESFAREVAFSRTFVLESEVAALRAQGFGRRTTARDLLVFGAGGIIDNELRTADECARHKVLDCIGDFALLGCDLDGRVRAERSGHELNRELAARLQGAEAIKAA